MMSHIVLLIATILVCVWVVFVVSNERFWKGRMPAVTQANWGLSGTLIILSLAVIVIRFFFND